MTQFSHMTNEDLVLLANQIMRTTDSDPSDKKFLKQIRDEIALRKPVTTKERR